MTRAKSFFPMSMRQKSIVSWLILVVRTYLSVLTLHVYLWIPVFAVFVMIRRWGPNRLPSLAESRVAKGVGRVTGLLLALLSPFPLFLVGLPLIVLMLRLAQGNSPWTLRALYVSSPMFAVYALFIIADVERIRQASSCRPGCCVECQYDLRGNVSGVCPECGTQVNSMKVGDAEVVLSCDRSKQDGE